MNTQQSITVAIDDILTDWHLGVLSTEGAQHAATASS